MKGIIRFTALVVFLGVAWVAIPMLVGRDKEPEKRLVGALNFVQNTVQYSRSVPFDVDVFDTPTIERESQPDVWSINATLTIPVRTGTVIREPYTAVVENLCQPYKERKCWRLIQLTIGDAVLGNQTGSIRAALETLAPDIVRIPILDAPAVDLGQVALGAANAGFMVELSAFGTAEVTMRERKRLQVDLSDLLGNTKLTVERIDLGERGVHYQVQANSFPDRLTANYMCARVRARKGFCQVVTPSSIARALGSAKTTSPAFTSRPKNSLPTTTLKNGKYYAHAGVRAQNSGVFGKAIEFYSKAIESDDLSRKDLARVFNNRGAAYKNLEFYDLAIDDYNTAIRLKKDYARAYYNRGIALGSKGLLDDAIKDYSMSLKLNPDDAATYNNRGLAYERAGLHKKAIVDFSRAISLAPDLSYAYYNRGLAYEVANERRRAIMDFRKSYSLNPDNSTYQAKMKDIGLLQ